MLIYYASLFFGLRNESAGFVAGAGKDMLDKPWINLHLMRALHILHEAGCHSLGLQTQGVTVQRSMTHFTASVYVCHYESLLLACTFHRK